MLQSRVPRIEYGRAVPAGFGGGAAHAIGDQAQSGCGSRPGCKLQPPTGGQRQRLGDLQHDHGDGTIPQCLFRDGQCLGLVLGQRYHQTRRVKSAKS